MEGGGNAGEMNGNAEDMRRNARGAVRRALPPAPARDGETLFDVELL